MTNDPNLRYKNLLETAPPGAGSTRATSADAAFNPDFPGSEILMNININDKAPEFTLQDENDKQVSLKALRGKVVVLYFYPRADTPGCTVEACAFRDTYKQIQKTGAVLLGISPDTPKAQKNSRISSSSPFLYWLMPTRKSPRPTASFRKKICMARK